MEDIIVILCFLFLISFFIPEPKPKLITPPEPKPITKPVKEVASIILGKKSGKQNAIVITSKNSQIMVDKPLMMVKLIKGGKMSKPIKISEDKLQSDFGNVLNATPQKEFSINLFFKSGVSLTNNSKKDIPKIIQEIKNRQPCIVSIAGYSDTLGDKKTNLKVSKKRAQSIKKLIEKRKVKIQSIKILALGESNLLIPTKDEIDNEQNRRVEITIK